MSKNFQSAYAAALGRTRTNLNLQISAQEKLLVRKLTAQEKKPYLITQALRDQLQQETRYQVISNLMDNLSARLQQPVNLTEKDLQNHYLKSRALPMAILQNINPVQVARFEEQSAAEPGMDLEVHAIRYYPYGTTAAHLLGYLARNMKSDDEDPSERKFNYWLPDFIGVSGIEKLFDDELHGSPGEKSVVVNYLGYRQSESIWSPPEAGQNVALTIDLDIQKAADEALDSVKVDARGAVVVMDVRNGDILALASSPTYNPNHFIQRPPPSEIWLQGMGTLDERNHAGGNEPRAAGACMHPARFSKLSLASPRWSRACSIPRRFFTVSDIIRFPGMRNGGIGDTAGAGDFDFDRALAKSSNPYFITQGLKPGVLQKMVSVGPKGAFW